VVYTRYYIYAIDHTNCGVQRERRSLVTYVAWLRVYEGRESLESRGGYVTLIRENYAEFIFLRKTRSLRSPIFRPRDL